MKTKAFYKSARGRPCATWHPPLLKLHPILILRTEQPTSIALKALPVIRRPFLVLKPPNSHRRRSSPKD